MMKFYTYQQYLLEDPQCSALTFPFILKVITQKNSLQIKFILYIYIIIISVVLHIKNSQVRSFQVQIIKQSFVNYNFIITVVLQY